jgi:hypothetical protein
MNPGADNVVSICHEQSSDDGILSVYTKSGRTTKELLKALATQRTLRRCEQVKTRQPRDKRAPNSWLLQPLVPDLFYLTPF